MCESTSQVFHIDVNAFLLLGSGFIRSHLRDRHSRWLALREGGIGDPPGVTQLPATPPPSGGGHCVQQCSGLL